MKRFLSLILFAVAAALGIAADAPLRVVKITPPQLDAAHLGERIVCYRPLRLGGPLLNVQKISGKIVATSAGHGGSGWTLGPGSVNYVLRQLEGSLREEGMGKSEPITVLGAGVMGLMAAVELTERGYTAITVVAASFDHLTSHNAGGQFAPVALGSPPEEQAIMDQIGFDSYKYYRAIIDNTHPYLSRGAVRVPEYFENLEDFGLEPYVKAGVMRPAEKVIVDFQNGMQRELYLYEDCIFMDVGTMMTDLFALLQKRGVSFLQKKVDSLAEIKDRVIFNGTGHGSKKLLNDDAFVWVQGHLIMLKDQHPADMMYMAQVYFDTEGTTSSGLSCKRSFYLFPKHLPGSGENDIGVLGGTYIMHGTPENPHLEEFDTVLENAKKFFGIQ